MATEDEQKSHEVVLLYADAFGWVDVENCLKYLDTHCCTECWVYLNKAPVGRVQQAVEEDERIEIRVTDNPKKSAKNFYDELKSGGSKVQMMRLEKVSDRSMNKGAC